VVLDQHGIRLANSARRDLVFHPAFRLPPAEVEALTASLEFGERTQTLLQQVVEFEAGFLRARGAALPDDFTTPNAANGLNNLAHMRRLRNAPWTLFVMVPEPSLNAPVRSLVESTAAANAGVVLFALIVGGLVAGRIVRPIRSLSDAAERMRNGDLTARVPVSSRDEVGQLGDAFNAMAFTLASAQEQLEEKVRARTEALASAKVSLERQNADLALRAAELTERQTRDLSFARTLSALAGTGPMRDAIVLALSEADTYLDSLMLACYRLDKDKQSPARLVPMASRGSEAHPLPLSGRVAEAFAAHKPVVVTLPEGAELRFETGIARGRPQCVALVPLSMGERDVGLLMAGFPGRPLGQQIAFMVELALPLALTVARHELLEQTERFALQLAQRNEVLREQSNELAAKQTELTQKNVEIERANQLKSEFLANMSHELRTPLNAVIGFSELMLESPERMPQDHVQFVRDILASGRHLLSLINAVLDLAKIEAGRVSLELEPIDAREAMMTACALVSAMAQKKHLAVSQICRTSRSALADAGKLQQVLLNLLSNAIKFSQEGKRIEVGVEDQGEFLRFWVRDEGPGIPESLRRDLFKPFMQGESPLQKQHEGTGLGLAITRRLVEHHGGEVGVESEMGRGSTFWALMPAAERTAAAAEPALPIAPAPVPAERPRVLVVEDDPANARLLRFHLESDGYAVFEATREKEALETVRRVRPQLVLLDLILPEGEDGLNVLRELKSNEETAKTPVVVVSVVQETRKARELGAAECFVKPIDAQRLMETVQRLCPSTAKAKPRATVLVVDDHDLNRELAKTLLERRGCRVVLARDGEQGVQMARAERPDLVLLDLAMPVKDGLTAARELKADPQTKAIPLVAFTALAMRGDEERARKAGFDGYLSKPLEKSALDATLARFISLPLQQSGT
jgi:signal transduction histidine kinase/DNA-binding response OmpR family regulator